jgi:hypothetical protein
VVKWRKKVVGEVTNKKEEEVHKVKFAPKARG